MTSELKPCKNCGSKAQTWSDGKAVKNGIQQNRLNTNDVECFFHLGCDDCGETLKIISAEQVVVGMNTRAVPDVPELVAVSHEVFYAPTREWRKTVEPEYYRKNGDLVRDLIDKSKAAEIIAAKDKYLDETIIEKWEWQKRAEAAEAELAISKTERHADGEYIGSLEAELAQIKAQEPVAWMHPEARWTDVSKQDVAVHCKVGTYPLPLYDSPVSDSMKAECDRYKEALGLCQRTLAMIIDPKSIVSTTSIIAFASATEAEAKARAVLKGDSNDKG